MTKLSAEKKLKENQKIIDIDYSETGLNENGFTDYKNPIELETKLIHSDYKYDYMVLELQSTHADYVVPSEAV